MHPRVRGPPSDPKTCRILPSIDRATRSNSTRKLCLFDRMAAARKPPAILDAYRAARAREKKNRDRRYADDVYVVRGIYNVQDQDFNLSQFGMFLQNDTLFLTVHLNDIVERIGRKPMSGDVIEFPHMKEDYSLDESVPIALKRYYVVEDVNRAAEGFSQTWWPHLLRLKMKTNLYKEN